jgi:hypothetical protein
VAKGHPLLGTVPFRPGRGRLRQVAVHFSAAFDHATPALMFLRALLSLALATIHRSLTAVCV